MIDFSTDTNKATLTQKLSELSFLKNEKLDAEAKLEEVKKKHSELSEEIFLLMEADNMTSITINGRNYHCRLDRYMGFVDKAKGHDWLIDIGLGDLIQPSVNSRTLTAEVKRLEAEGAEIPDGMLNERTVRRIGDTKGKK